MAAKKAEDFPKLLATLQEVFRTKYPPHVLAIPAFYGLQAGVSDEGVADNTLIKGLEQHHIELLQALALTIPIADWTDEPPESGDIQIVIDTVIALCQAFHQRRFSAIEKERDLQARTILGLQERIRLHTQVVRNWGYFSDVMKISAELYAPLDNQFKNALGFSASDVIAVAKCLVSTREQRSNERFQLLRRIFRGRKINQIVRQFFKKYPHVEGDPEEFIRIIPKGTSREAVIARLLSHADFGLPQLLLYSPDDLASQLALSPAVVTKILQALSLPVGALHDEDVERFFLSNPVWHSPIIRISGKYFCPIPQGIFSHIHDVLRSIADTVGLRTALEERRAKYLEDKVRQLLATALPTAELRHSIKWRSGSVEYETDHLAMIDRTVVIVEDKSGTLSAPALRGASDRFKRHVSELVFAPSEQSARLETMIEQAKGGETSAVESLSAFGVDFSQVSRVVRISVTLDDFSVVCSAEGELKEAGWIPSNLALATTLNVADFQSVVDILDRPSFFVHYFAERQRIQKAMNLFGDEMDYLGVYLQNGFNMWGVETSKARVALTGMSQAMDRYYNGRDAGVSLRKPTPRLQPYFANLIRTMEERAYPNWLNVTTDLLRCADFDEQKKLDRMLAKLKANVKRNWRDPDHECSIAITPPEIHETVIVFYVYPNKLAARRKETAQILASKALEMSQRPRCIVISRNIDRWSDPYSFVLIATADDAE